MESQTLHWNHPNIMGPELLELLRTSVPQSLGGTLPVTATVLTLGLYVKGILPTDWAELAGKISRVHPSRVLIINPIVNSANAPTHVDAELSATITYRRPHEPPILFSECVQMNLQGGLANHWIDLVQSLIKSDLPAYLLWLGMPPLPGFRWDLLSTGFSHLVIDTEQTGIEPWHHVMLQSPRLGLMIDDLYWQRLGLWRVHWANVTDRPEALAVVSTPESISVVWPVEKSTGWQMLLGWLVSRLSWQIVDIAPNRLLMATESGNTIPVHITTGADPGITFYQGNRRLSSQEAHNQLTTQFEIGSDVLYEISDPCNLADPVSDVVKLLNRGHDQLYDEAMSALLLSERPEQ
ncbi:MAG: glucose-6-phosphate dehydrogenase assembly protein OpcA [Sulfobacillus thermotolerans]|uniref:Glucose-6-phosphate dehydrogenase subunit n=1 Tax=Sulfobacillus thermotolerans TaxID=338644 RepID=A0ABN5H0A5_9FIRM|nr:hypothetical protein BXT84_09120 [Sulfobacillus thermotolerans]MCY0908907.1 glucose-6-phosphate dehydrogenase assembly protein OpcA [Sulfobacillus thermotolerans]